MIMRTVLLAALAIWGCTCNLWDNIYSQTSADTPIILSQSLNFEFSIRENLSAKMDFNADLETVTLYLYLNVLLKMELLRAQLDLQTLVVSVERLNSKNCERFNIAGFKNGLSQSKVSKERLFLINLLFKFVGKTQPTLMKRIVYNIYKFEPFLLEAPSRLKDLQDDFKDELPSDVNFDEDYLPDVQLYLHVNSVSGNLEAIYSGEKMDVKVPFSTTSSVRAKSNCDAEVHALTTADLKKLFDFVQENRKEK